MWPARWPGTRLAALHGCTCMSHQIRSSCGTCGAGHRGPRPAPRHGQHSGRGRLRTGLVESWPTCRRAAGSTPESRSVLLLTMRHGLAERGHSSRSTVFWGPHLRTMRMDRRRVVYTMPPRPACGSGTVYPLSGPLTPHRRRIERLTPILGSNFTNIGELQARSRSRTGR